MSTKPVIHIVFTVFGRGTRVGRFVSNTNGVIKVLHAAGYTNTTAKVNVDVPCTCEATAAANPGFDFSQTVRLVAGALNMHSAEVDRLWAAACDKE